MLAKKCLKVGPGQIASAEIMTGKQLPPIP
jgi:hypothetical protein